MSVRYSQRILPLDTPTVGGSPDDVDDTDHGRRVRRHAPAARRLTRVSRRARYFPRGDSPRARPAAPAQIRAALQTRGGAGVGNRGSMNGSVAKFDFWAKSKNWVSGFQRLTDSQTLEKATLRQNPHDCSPSPPPSIRITSPAVRSLSLALAGQGEGVWLSTAA